MSTSFFKKGVAASIIIILILTVLEFPAPIGFETRPQSGVSIYWLFFFLTILGTEIAAIPFVFTYPQFGTTLGIIAAVLNIFQVIADQTHLMQPEVASVGYSLLEWSVALASAVLLLFSWKIKQLLR